MKVPENNQFDNFASNFRPAASATIQCLSPKPAEALLPPLPTKTFPRVFLNYVTCWH